MKKRQWEVERDAIAAALPAWVSDTEDVPLVDLVKSAIEGFESEIARLRKELDLAQACGRLAKTGYEADVRTAKENEQRVRDDLTRLRRAFARLIEDGIIQPDPDYPVRAR